MTVDRTLKVSGGLLRTRSVLTRAERIAHLTEEGEFNPEEDSPLGLPKVRVRHSKAGTKTKKAEEPKPEAGGPEETEAQTPPEGPAEQSGGKG